MMTSIQIDHLHLTENERNTLQTFADKVQQRFSGQVYAIQLFGSRARGDARPDSDMDILVIMASADLATRRTIRDLATEVWLTHGIYLSTRVWTIADHRRHATMHTAFYGNLQQDAIDLLIPVAAK